MDKSPTTDLLSNLGDMVMSVGSLMALRSSLSLQFRVEESGPFQHLGFQKWVRWVRFRTRGCFKGIPTCF